MQNPTDLRNPTEPVPKKDFGLITERWREAGRLERGDEIGFQFLVRFEQPINRSARKPDILYIIYIIISKRCVLFLTLPYPLTLNIKGKNSNLKATPLISAASLILEPSLSLCLCSHTLFSETLPLLWSFLLPNLDACLILPNPKTFLPPLVPVESISAVISWTQCSSLSLGLSADSVSSCLSLVDLASLFVDLSMMMVNDVVSFSGWSFSLELSANLVFWLSSSLSMVDLSSLLVDLFVMNNDDA